MATQAKLVVAGDQLQLGVLNALEAEYMQQLVDMVPGIRMADRARFDAEGYELYIPHTAWELPIVRGYIDGFFGADQPQHRSRRSISFELDGAQAYAPANLRDYQQAAVDFILSTRRGAILADQMGTGKAIRATEPVLTPVGWRQIGALEVGDLVVDPDTGHGVTVRGVYPQGRKKIYRVALGDSTSTLVDGEHLWAVYTAGRKFRGAEPLVLTTLELIERGLRTKSDKRGWTNRKWFLPITQPVHFDVVEGPRPWAPYVFGVFLGDGYFGSSVTVALPDAEIEDRCATLGVRWGAAQRADTPARCRGALGAVAEARTLGVHGKRSWEKGIPLQYLRASVADRIELLRGLMDTDGDCAKGGAAIFNTSSPQLRDDVVDLVRALGGIASVSTRKEPKYTYKGETRTGREAYRVNVRVLFNPFHLARKAERWTKPNLARGIESIEPAGEDEAVCIAVDSKRSLYITTDYIVTHNTRTAAAAAICLQRRGGGGDYFIQPEPGGNFVKAGTRYARPIFILAPKYLRETWREELEKIGALEKPGDFAVVETRSPHGLLKDGRTRAQALGAGHRFYFAHYDIIEAWWGLLWPLKPCAVIMDEAHFLKNSRTRRAKGAALAASTSAKNILLTGTPLENRAGELWNLLNLAAGKWSFGGPLDFRRRYMGAVHTGFGHEDQGPTNTEELQLRLETCYLRRTVNDVKLDLPPITRELIQVDLDEKQAAKYGDLFDGYAPAAVFEAIMRGALGKKVLTMLGKARKLTSAAKREATIAEAQSALDQGESVVVFTWERRVAEQIADKLEVPRAYRRTVMHGRQGVSAIHGGFSQTVRDIRIRTFQEHGGCLVATMASLGVGVNLQRARVVIMHDLDWTPSRMLQAEARVWRGGQTKNVISKWIVARGTLDALITKALLEKADLIAKLLDDHEPAQLEEVLAEVATGASYDAQDYADRWTAWRQL